MRVAQETLAILDSGSFSSPTGVSLDISAALSQCSNQASFWDREQLERLKQDQPGGGRREDYRIEVTEEGAITAVRRLTSEHPGSQVTLLNFASAKNPCGGMIKGALAQEESIGLCSGLLKSQQSFLDTFYLRHRQEPRDGLYSHSMIWSPQVPVFRDDVSLDLLEEVALVNMVTSCAVNLGHYKRQGGAESAAEVEMRTRVELVVRLAVSQGTEVLVLGAWGCGVFGWPPGTVARFFYDILVKQGWAKYFRRVVFAIASQGTNFDAFSSTFL